MSEGQSIYVPLGAKHRMENPSKTSIILIEVQIGTYLGEDDIIRYEDVYACNGILFNHESPRRGETFVTRKITRGLANTALGLERCLHMGNIDALRDWGHAKDYVHIQWMMLQQDEAKG